MNRLFAATMLAGLCAVGLSAQIPATQPKPEEKDKIVTATGCLRAGEEPSTFVLANVKWPDKTDKTKVVGTAGADDTASTGETLRLVGSPSGVRMSEHVGHMVEVTGVIVDEARPQTTSELNNPARTGTGGDQTSRAQRPPAQVPSPQTLNVRTVKMIGESCSG
jgi:hypothetical protein